MRLRETFKTYTESGDRYQKYWYNGDTHKIETIPGTSHHIKYAFQEFKYSDEEQKKIDKSWGRNDVTTTWNPVMFEILFKRGYVRIVLQKIGKSFLAELHTNDIKKNGRIALKAISKTHLITQARIFKEVLSSSPEDITLKDPEEVEQFMKFGRVRR